MKLFQWIEGRQSNTKYWKWCFLYWRIGRWGFDGYFLKYEKDTRLPIHTDPVQDAQHWRLNIRLKGKCKFWCPSKIFDFFDGTMIYFRPDKFPHCLIVFTECFKLSIGIVKFNRL